MSKFSERAGITKPKTLIQVASMDVNLRNSLWNMLEEYYWVRGSQGIKISKNGLG
jgi:hypothetical protein